MYSVDIHTMFRYKILLFILLITITYLFICCDNSGNGYVDEGGFEIRGIVLDSASQLPIVDVMVGFTDYPDSILFVGDSINVLYTNTITVTNDLGRFRIAEIGLINIQDFQKMFAWKKENKLWLYKDEPVKISEIGKSSYELTIFLTKSNN